MPVQYSVPMVLLSFSLALVGAFVALTASEQYARRRDWLNLAAASVALGGIGVWAMHFAGMLALRLRMGVSYSLLETLASLLVAVLACGAALRAVNRERTIARLLASGTALGLAVCAMHYIGMAGMHFNGYMTWSLPTVALSVLVAVAAATAGLWLAVVVRGVRSRVAASSAIASAVCAMHYTGMAAADFICTSANPVAFPTGAGLVTSLDLPDVIASLSFGMAGLIAVDQALQRATQWGRRVPARSR
jgi:NO-binding membrane sensor protein with MHYT domain